jgi:tRNA threonylcarbamoyladenosine biosynthesis protein TsaB
MNDLLTLGIETSGKTASVALVQDNIMLAQNSVYTDKTHSQVILPMVKKIVEDCEKNISDIHCIAVGAGPGSYTGIRIGIAAVKAMAFANNIQCCGISTLEGLVYNYPIPDGIVCAVMKARQTLVYAIIFQFEKHVGKRLTDDMIIESAELDAMLKQYNQRIVLTGDASEAFAGQFYSKNYNLAPVHLRNQSAAGICAASANHHFYSPDELEASYLQLVKAEKDLLNKQ